VQKRVDTLVVGEQPAADIDLVTRQVGLFSFISAAPLVLCYSKSYIACFLRRLVCRALDITLEDDVRVTESGLFPSEFDVGVSARMARTLLLDEDLFLAPSIPDLEEEKDPGHLTQSPTFRRRSGVPQEDAFMM